MKKMKMKKMKPLKSLTVASSLFMLSISSHAQEDVGTMLKNCAAEKDSLARLVCYDNLASKADSLTVVKEAPVLPAAQATPVQTAKPSAPVVATPPAAAVVASANTADDKEEFGLKAKPAETKEEFGLKEKPAEDFDRIYLEVSGVKEARSGERTFTFTNGQVWKQIGSDYFRVYGDSQIFIERGALNSFNLGQEGKTRMIKVKRIK